MAVQAHTSQLRIGEWLVSPALDHIERSGQTVKLEPRTMRLLLRLSEAPGDVVSSRQLLDDVWAGVIVGPQSVYQAISQLRKLLGDVDATPTYIATIPRKGYRLIAHVEKATPAAPRAAPVVDGPVESPPTDAALLQPRVGRGVGVFGARIWPAAAALILTALATYIWSRDAWQADARRTSIVVLPFVDMTDGHTDAAFSDGLTEELSTSLSQLPTLRVVARTSAYAVRDQKLDVRQIGEKLAATHIIEGTVRRSGDVIRVTAQLVDVRSGHRSWSEAYDLPAKELLRLQGDIAKSVANALEIRFSEQDSRRLMGRSSKNTQAYELYLLGRHHFRQRTPEANARSIDLTTRALALDPEFALAQVGLAQAKFNELAFAGKSIGSANEIEPLIASGLQLNPDLAEGYATRGAMHRELNRLEPAVADLLRAIKLDPSNVMAIVNLGRTFEQQGRVREALQQFTAARDLDPLDFMRYVERCTTLTDLGRYSQAAVDCTEARRLQPESEWPWLASIWLARAQGRLAEAVRWSDEGLRTAQGAYVLPLERVDDLMTMGLVGGARDALRDALTQQPGNLLLEIRFGDLLHMEQGPAAAREHLAKLDVNAQSSAVDLLAAAQLALAIGAADAARRYVALALAAKDAVRIDSTRSRAARFGLSYELPLAVLDLRRGDQVAATTRLHGLLDLLEALEQNGQTTWGVHSLRAEAFALLGDDANAVGALERAIDAGWREAWLASSGPLARVSDHDALRTLLQRVERLNAAERETYRTYLADSSAD